MTRQENLEPFEVLLYYLYAEIANPMAYRKKQIELCQSLGLLGRIIVAQEGINGTVSGTRKNCEDYRQSMQNDPITAGIEFKIDEVEGHVFPKLSVKARYEIVTLGLEEDFSPTEVTRQYLEPAEWKQAMQDPNIIIIDARNDYESNLGYFKGAIRPKVQNFKEFPQWIEAHREELEGKRILTYCTGGIRCEKLNGLLVNKGFGNVSQLHGGIVKYGKDEATRGEGFLGKCYVFDQRIGVSINRVDGDAIVGRCYHCKQPSDVYQNCRYAPCNLQHFVCKKCREREAGFCSKNCLELENNQVA